MISAKYSSLDEIDRDNVADLAIAWRWKTENFEPKPDYNFRAAPLMVDGVLYTTAGSRRVAAAIDAATGETLWLYRPDEPDLAPELYEEALGILRQYVYGPQFTQPIMRGS